MMAQVFGSSSWIWLWPGPALLLLPFRVNQQLEDLSWFLLLTLSLKLINFLKKQQVILRDIIPPCGQGEML